MNAKRLTCLALASLLTVAVPAAVLAQSSPTPSGTTTQAPASASAPSKDALLQRLTARAKSLSAQIAAAEKSGHLSQSAGKALSTKVTQVVKKARADHQTQGFLSAGESASYMRELDQVQSTLGTPKSTQPKTP